jgi:hypothetical protein
MHFNFHDVFYSHQHVSAAIAAIFTLMLLLQEHNGTNAFSCVVVTPQQMKIIIISVTII